MRDNSIGREDVWKHFKGDDYVILELPMHTETGEELVIYKRASGLDRRVWARPLKMFLEDITEGVPRFTRIKRAHGVQRR